jgi:hypothetical protein
MFSSATSAEVNGRKAAWGMMDGGYGGSEVWGEGMIRI